MELGPLVAFIAMAVAPPPPAPRFNTSFSKVVSGLRGVSGRSALFRGVCVLLPKACCLNFRSFLTYLVFRESVLLPCTLRNCPGRSWFFLCLCNWKSSWLPRRRPRWGPAGPHGLCWSLGGQSAPQPESSDATPVGLSVDKCFVFSCYAIAPFSKHLPVFDVYLYCFD